MSVTRVGCNLYSNGALAKSYYEECSYTMINGTGQWNDLNDGYDAGFILEIPLDIKPDNTLVINDTTYEFHITSMPYSVADKFCVMNGKMLWSMD